MTLTLRTESSYLLPVLAKVETADVQLEANHVLSNDKGADWWLSSVLIAQLIVFKALSTVK